VQHACSLRERSLEELLWSAVASRLEGLVVLRDRDGLRHGVWIHAGFVVGVHVAGRFDPLLDLLRRQEALSAHGYRACVDALWSSATRSGSLAMQLGGVPRAAVRDALKQQTCERMTALLELAMERGHDAWFEPRTVAVAEMSVRMPLGALLRQVPQGQRPDRPAAPPARDRSEERRRLRELAKRLHPDRNSHLDPETRRALEHDLARATAQYHGFA
jgi:hypothetical protein